MSKEEQIKQRMDIMEKHMTKTEKSDCFEVFFDYQKAMQEYLDQNTKPLIEEIAELKGTIEVYKQDWKVMNDEIAKLKASKSEANEGVEFAAYLSVNNWESSNGIMYNKFRMEYGSKYIITTENINKLYKIFKTRNNK